jgi:putative membrane protein
MRGGGVLRGCWSAAQLTIRAHWPPHTRQEYFFGSLTKLHKQKGSHMYRFILRWAINAIAIYAAIVLLENVIPGGIALQNPGWQTYIWLGLIFGLVNALLRPLLAFLTCPLIMLTLGLFTLVINTFLFYLVGWIGRFFNVGYTVNSFWAALLGAIIVSVVSIALSLLIREDSKRGRRREK